ncbi:uncharacterized protein [Physcomitrium patens]|uniref:Uncharacterized protein n=1 Tax=Physcomitrium patens TaxID=3218 RepID=A0A2K1K3M1_PHYPA|nr:hypothetical protein PHYPA_012840 [Physcomitrium patens]
MRLHHDHLSKLYTVTPQQVVLQRWQWQSPSTSCSHHKAPKQSLACTTWCFFMDCKLKEEAELGRAPWSLPRRVPMDKMWVGLVYEAIIVLEASAIRLCGNHHHPLPDRNHVEVCKPPSKEHASYFHLKDLRLYYQLNLQLLTELHAPQRLVPL